MAKKQTDRALGLDPLEDIADLIWEEAETVADVGVRLPAREEPTETERSPSQTRERDETATEKWDDETSATVAEPVDEDNHRLDNLIAAIDQEVEQTFEPGTVGEATTADSMIVQDEEQYVMFRLGGTEYAVPIMNVVEIGRALKVTTVPNVPAWVLGVANLRGEVISIVDLRDFLGMGKASHGQASRMLVARTSGRDMTTALIVDRVSGIQYLSADQIVAPDVLTEDKITPYLRGVCEHDGRLLVVLNLERLLVSPEMQRFEPTQV